MIQLIPYLKEFKRCASLGILPQMRHFYLEEEFQGWEENIEEIYFNIKQLFWNSLYIHDMDEKKVLKYQLENLALSLLSQQRLLLRYKKYATTHNFKVRLASTQTYAILLYEYSSALGIVL